MEFNLNSLKNIIGEGNEVCVYGLSICGWPSLVAFLMRQKYQVYTWTGDKLPTLKYDNDGSAQRRAKATLTSLVLENHRRILEGKPIIPLIFPLSLDSANIDIKKTALSHKNLDSSFTDRELRRIYKIAEETNDIIKQVAAATFIFVTLTYNPDDKQYHFEKIPPFWKNLEWNECWNQRKNSEIKFEKKLPWKMNLIQAVSLFKPNQPNRHALCYEPTVDLDDARTFRI